jgi:hypothetical protein
MAEFFWASKPASGFLTAEARKKCPAYFDLEAHQKPAVVQFEETASDRIPELLVEFPESV